MTTHREQLRIEEKCFHPTSSFVEFEKDQVEQSIPQRFERIAGTHPERLALKSGKFVYTYDSLNRAANTLAHILLESSQESVAFLSAPTRGVVSLLGILKAGKSYLGLHPLTPVERNAFYLRDAGADFLVTDHEHYGLARALAQDGQRIVILDELGAENDANPGVAISPDAAAGIFYTSGSTGQPKGVIHSHRNILHEALIRINGCHFCVEDRLSLTNSLDFSGSIRNVFPCLLVGAALLPYDIRKNTVANFGQWVEEERITYVFLRRQLLRGFAALCSGGSTFAQVRWLHLGGELIHRSDIETFQQHMPDSCVLSINYASTEAGSITRCLADKWSVLDEEDRAPVGFPCDDVEVCLVDGNGNEVAPGEVGEIVVTSRYLSPGYWHRPDLTNRVFSTDPQDGQRRVYRTGDLGRFSAEGCLFHLGRNDSQVKVRGYRVELNEVEHLLLKHPFVQEAVVKSFTQENGDIRIVGYVVPVDGETPTVSELRRHLGISLADYMIPSTFVLVDVLPTSINGKVDRNALPAPERTRPELAQPYCPPGTMLETKLARIWGELLQLDRVGIHDDFLELGGQSILATQLVGRIRESLQVDVSVSELLELSTISGVAEVLETRNWLAEKPIPVDPGGSETETI